jgi:hypothetical protein
MSRIEVVMLIYHRHKPIEIRTISCDNDTKTTNTLVDHIAEIMNV